jgi:hypothetical protein
VNDYADEFDFSLEIDPFGGSGSNDFSANFCDRMYRPLPDHDSVHRKS